MIIQKIKTALIEKIIEVSEEIGSIHAFCEITDKVHKNIGCQKNHCDINCFLELVKEAISDPLKDYDSIRNLVIRQSVNYLNVFNCMLFWQSRKKKIEQQIEIILSDINLATEK